MKKNKLMKIVITVIMFVTMMNLTNVQAASFSVGASKSSVAPGGTFSVSVSVKGAGQFSVSASNGSVSSSSLWVDGSGNVTVTAGQSGSTTVTVTAVDVTGSDESAVTGSKSVSVSIKSSSSGGNSGNSSGNSGGATTTPKTDDRSKENNLSSLNVSTGTLSPEFSASKTTYKVELTSDVQKITVNAKAKDSKAKVSGTGEHELKVGENNISIVVTAENGSKKTYTISVYVTEKPSVFLKLGDQNLGILNDLSKADTPKGFEPTKVTVDGKEVTALKNDTLGLTLLYLQNGEGGSSFYIYENNAISQKFETVTVNGKVYVLINAPDDLESTNGLKKGTVKIGELEVQGWTFEDDAHSNFCIVYLMNEAGEKSLYSYESTEGTIQKYVANVETSNNTLTYVFIGTTVVFAAATAGVAWLYINFKKKSISAIKDYYDKKNQGE